jgi:[ribosomal protein S5]-alanine N-acetyltransferase
MTLQPSDAMIETERLSLRRVDASDLEFLKRIHADPDVARYLGDGQSRWSDSTGRWLDDVQNSYATARLGQLMVLRKVDGTRLGHAA